MSTEINIIRKLFGKPEIKSKPDDSVWSHMTFVFLTALTLYIPAIVSIWTQPFPITIILFVAATWSSIYHYHKEQEFQEMDVIWANLTSLFTGLMMILVSMQYGFFSKEVIQPLILAIIALIIYIQKASVKPGASVNSVPNYDFWHGVWHCLTSLTALLLVKHKTNYKYVLKPFIYLIKERMDVPLGKINKKAF